MNIEDFLLKNGDNYRINVIGLTDGVLKIEIESLVYDADDTIKEYHVIENEFIPIETTYLNNNLDSINNLN